ncbi:hypothetical protein COL922a_010775 [Colletotrichum nupharicola]|nr:hypothetical protein COL940_009733 [Colletotrichum noveboracense]KAJ0383297.1 hypothetical protein COL922a_010775 [Colletotrichum nupharicola]
MAAPYAGSRTVHDTSTCGRSRLKELYGTEPFSAISRPASASEPSSTIPLECTFNWSPIPTLPSSQTSFTSESSDDEDNESTGEAASAPTKSRKTEKPEDQIEEPEKKKKNIVTRFGLWLSK